MFSDLEEIESILKGEIDKIGEQLASGMCEDYVHYKHLTGMIEGLTRSIHVLKDYSSRVLEEMDNDNNIQMYFLPFRVFIF